jgi:ribose transport system substrate-binding protein
MINGINLRAARPAAALMGACALFLLSGCHKGTNSDSTNNPAAPSAASNQTMLAFVTHDASAYWILCNKGADAAAKELGNVNLKFVEPGKDTVAAQKLCVDDLLTQGVKGIAISPSDPAKETAYLNTVAAKTNLITSDSDAPKSSRLCYIGTDNHAAGIMAGGLIKEALPQGGKIMLFVGSKDAQNAHDRISGIQDALQGSNVRISGISTDDSSHERADQNAAAAIAAHPDLAGMVGIWSYNGPAIYKAVKGAGKQGKIKIIAFDQEAVTMTGIKDGTIYGAVVQQPYQFGYQSIKMLDQLAKGDNSGIPSSKLIIIPTQAIKKDNVDTYLAGQARLMEGS